MAFYEQLLDATARDRAELLSLPLIGAGARGEISRATYIAFLAEAYHHVKHTVPLLMACGARLPESMEWLRLSLAEYVQEELGHQEWILSDIAAAGGDAEAVRAGSPCMATELMVAYAWDTIQRGNPVGFLGMVLVLENTSVSVASHAADAIARGLGLPASAFTYLRSHGALDVAHQDFYAALVNRLDDPADRRAVIHCARVFYKLYGDIFRDLERQALAALEEAA